ncbi:hypothetical protein [Streptomyces sp. NPDC020965]|uniref:hypothetical protein n=1 Tax=Streptomyces sp. NPDC020965 TaxID=3365105 RepID=UPI0037B1DEA2
MEDRRRVAARRLRKARSGSYTPPESQPPQETPPHDGRPFVGRQELIGRLLRELTTARVLELHGPAGIGKSEIARRLTLLVGDSGATGGSGDAGGSSGSSGSSGTSSSGDMGIPDRPDRPEDSDRPEHSDRPDDPERPAHPAHTDTPVHWLPVSESAHRPEVPLLKLLGRLGVPPSELRASLPDFPDATPGELVEVIRRELRRRPAVVVADGVPAGRPGAGLLTSLTDAVRGTAGLIVATSGESHADSVRSLPSHAVPPLTEEQGAEFLGLPTTERHPLVRASHGFPLFLRLAESLLREVRAGVADSAVAQALDVALYGAGGGRPVPRTPDDLFALSRRALTPRADALLTLLAQLEMEDLPDAMTDVLGGTGPFRELSYRGLLQRPRPGHWRLPLALRELVTPRRTPGERLRSRELVEGAIAGALARTRTPAWSDIESLVLLAARTLHSADPLARDCAPRLARDLGRRNDLSTLLMLRSSTLRHPSFDLPLAAVARQTGDITLATRLLRSHGDHEDARLELVENLRHSGLLDQATARLDGAPKDVAPGWQLHLRAALDCDRGAPAGAAALLRRAVETHQVAGSEHGEAWAAYHYGRLRLLIGDADGAAERLRFARGLFHRLDERRGVAWADTALARVLLLRGDRSRTVPALRRAVDGHRATDDPRGRAWTGYYLALALADEGSPDLASAELDRTVTLFRTVRDDLGLAWALHHRALLRPVAGGTLREALEVFWRNGSLNGLAWTLLELGAREADEGRLRSARGFFDLAGDEAGTYWTDLVAATLAGDGPGRARALKELCRFHPPGLLEGIGHPPPPGDGGQLPPLFGYMARGLPDAGLAPDLSADSGRRPARHRVALPPRAARYTVPEPLPEPPAPTPPAPPRPDVESHVRLTLLDDDVFCDVTARIALRVEPGPGHPWAGTGDLPLLRVHAVPLTNADVEPAHSVPVRPASDGCEFRLTPHRTGPMRVRFTIEHRDSGSVLQQVETELDVRPAALLPPAPREA